MPLRVKFLAKSSGGDPTDYWRRFLPACESRQGDVEFLFRPDCRDYDWLVVYDDLPAVGDERFTLWREELACPRDNTLLITGEPATIKVYGKTFLAQFGHVLTSQEPWAVPHPRPIFSQCGLLWFYGKTHRQTAAEFPSEKSHVISTVCSAKRQRHTLHALRHEFTRRLAAQLPELEVFGHGHRFIASKAEALDPFRYHLAIENHRAKHHWTEKLADAFLGGCLPIYFGCPNVFEYFPEDSLIPIGLDDFDASLETIRRAIADHAYQKCLPAIREARRLVLEEYSTFPMLARLIPRLHQDGPGPAGAHHILSRHALRRIHPLQCAAYGIERIIIGRRARRGRFADLGPGFTK